MELRIFLVFLCFVNLSYCDFYDSIDKMHALMEMEKYYLEEVEKHLEEKADSLKTIKR